MAKKIISAKVSIVNGENQLTEIVRQSMLKTLFSKIGTISQNIKPKISLLISSELMNSSTVRSLIAGKLRDDFGLKSGEAENAVGVIIENIADNISVKILRGSNQYIASLAIDILPSNISFIDFSAGSYQSSGGQVDWLNWLLTKGTQVILGDFWLFENAKGPTRSGGKSIMIETGNVSRQPFRIDPEHAGTVNDNFITRSIQSVYPQAVDITMKEILRIIK